jgi:hypothetical protein
LVALDRTVEDYDTMAKREIVEVKRVKALRWVSSSLWRPFQCMS